MDNFTTNITEERRCNFSVSTGVALSVLTALVSVFGSCGNIFVLLIPYFCPRLRRNASSFLILNLCVADLVVTSIACPLNGAWILTKVEGKCGSGGNDLLLSAARRVVITFSSSASLFILTLVSVERLCVISWPLRYRTSITIQRLAIASIVGWTASLTFGIFAAFKAFDRSVRLFAVVGTLVNYVTITVCYVRIFIVIVRKRAVRNELHAHVARLQMQEKQVAKTMAIIIGVFTLCLVPFTVLRRLLRQEHNDVLYDALLVLALSHSAANPLIYFYRSKEFRLVVKRIVLTCRCCVHITTAET